MILGLGSDLIDIRRIEQAIERFGDRFLDRIFTEAERRKCDRRVRSGRELCPPICRQGGLLQGARHRLSPRRVLARPGGRQPAFGSADRCC